MNRLRILFIFIGIGYGALFLHGCCKVSCRSGPVKIHLIGFNSDETDTLLIIPYEKNGLFNNRYRPIYYTQFSVQGNTVTYNEGSFDFYQDYKIQLPGTAYEYKISGIKSSDAHCSCYHSDVKTLVSYQLDGIDINSSGITITK